ncbi:MAG: hypothetical protein ACYTEV_01645 [Planctomycetota bacterium]|jgi:hypothetical protein
MHLASLMLARQDVAANAPADGAPAATGGSINYLDILHEPGPVLEELSAMSFLWPTVMAVLGLLCILNGYRWHRPIVALIAFLGGIGIGRQLADGMESPVLLALSVGLLFAIVATPMLRVTVAVLAGATGAFIGGNVYRGLAEVPGIGLSLSTTDAWVGALVGFVAVAMLSLLLFRFVIVMFTSVGGAGMLVFGLVAMLMHVEDWREPVTRSLIAPVTRPDGQVVANLMLPMITLLAAVGGYIVQHSRLQSEGVPIFSNREEKKKSA